MTILLPLTAINLTSTLLADPLPAIHHVLLLRPGMKLACMVAFPPEILTRAKELIPILSANLKVYNTIFMSEKRKRDG